MTFDGATRISRASLIAYAAIVGPPASWPAWSARSAKPDGYTPTKSLERSSRSASGSPLARASHTRVSRSTKNSRGCFIGSVWSVQTGPQEDAHEQGGQRGHQTDGSSERHRELVVRDRVHRNR